jgi:pilus assembly protein Flp/PilA
MLRRMRKLFRSESGQGMSEYLIIVALVAVAAIAIVSLFGNNIRTLFANSTNALAGQTANAQGSTASVTKKTLKDFSDGK